MAIPTPKLHSAWRPAIVAALLAASLYAVTLWGTYVYDDVSVALLDRRVHEPWAWLDYFRRPYLLYAADPLWRPLTCLTYALHWRIHGELAWPLHAVNILLHAAIAAMVAVLANRMARSLAAAYIAGLLFAAHPVHVEAVANIAGRAELLCALGVLGALLIFLRRPLTIPRALAIAGCFAVAVLSKEPGLLLVPMLLTWLTLRRFVSREAPADQPERLALALMLLLLSCATLAYITYRESIMHLAWEKSFLVWTTNPIVRCRGIDRFLVPFSIVGRYVAMLIAPLKLSPDYGATVTGFVMRWNDPFWYVGVAAALAWLIALAVSIRRRSASLVMCLLSMAFAYGMIGNFLYIIGTVMADRLMYIPSAFFVIIIAMAFLRLPRIVGILLVSIVVSLFSVRTIAYAWRWNDALRLYSMTRGEFPDSIGLHVLEADQLMRRDRLDEAEAILARARRDLPESTLILRVSVQVAYKRNRPDEANQYERRLFDMEHFGR